MKEETITWMKPYSNRVIDILKFIGGKGTFGTIKIITNYLLAVLYYRNTSKHNIK